jgi:hypothetical protein
MNYPHKILFFALLPMVLAVNNTVTKACYYMDGTSAPDHRPCFPTTSSPDSHSPCCLLAPDTAGQQADVCLSGLGLCFADDGMIYEGGCTDPTGQASGCPQICPDVRTNWRGKGDEIGWTQGQSVEFWQVLSCPGQNGLCCRQTGSEDNCCANSSLILSNIKVGMPILAVANSTENTTSSTSSGPAASCSASITKGNANEVVCSNSKAKILGLSIGVSLGIVILVLAAAIAILVSRLRALQREYDSMRVGTIMAYAKTQVGHELDPEPNSHRKEEAENIAPVELATKPSELATKPDEIDTKITHR